MGDLYFDDIEDEATYTDEMILRDVRSLIKAGQREGPMLDYKSDVSDKDNWPETAAAFANTFGGLVIFGVEAKRDQPRRLTGFDPRSVEIKTRLVSTLLSRIQPRPDLQVRVVTLDTDPTREVAVLRVSEGSHPPYMHSKGEEHRVYTRVGAQKAEADYLQLSALFEKRGWAESQAAALLTGPAGSQSWLYVTEPGSVVLSRNWYKFVLAPDDDRAARRLTIEVERQFEHCIERVYEASGHEMPVIRDVGATCFRGTGSGGEQRFTVNANGCLGFVTHACIKLGDGRFFVLSRLCRDVVRFLVLAAAFYEKSRYYGSSLLDVSLAIPDEAPLLGLDSGDSRPLPDSGSFEPPLDSIRVDLAGSRIPTALHPVTGERLQEYLEVVMNDLARRTGRVLSSSFRASTQRLADDALARLHLTP
ncbi:MAG: helix-turn-helix domain-containing protein [Bryobacteraceae bacterium]